MKRANYNRICLRKDLVGFWNFSYSNLIYRDHKFAHLWTTKSHMMKFNLIFDNMD